MNFDQVGKQHISKRRKPSPVREKKRSPSSFDSNFSQNVWPRTSRAGNAGESRSGKGFSIPLSWIKNLCLAAGVLVIGLVGTNWDSISGAFGSMDISDVSLRDTGTQVIMVGRVEPIVQTPRIFSDTIPITEPAPTATVPTTEENILVYEEIPLNLTETFSWTEYPVKAGDTVSGIASRFSLSIGSIIAFNNIKESWNLRVGTTLKIPNMEGIPHTVQKNETISSIAVKQKVPQNAILDANNLSSDTIHPGDVLFIPGAKMDAREFNLAFDRNAARRAEKPDTPAARMIFPVASRRITSGYGWREDPVRPRPGEKTFHKAVDLAGRMGDPVKAAMAGTVLHVDNNPNLGNFIILKHGEYQTLYAHLSAYSVKTGQKVAQGDEIGKVGDTGYTTGPHLHFEVFRNGNRINPLDLLK